MKRWSKNVSDVGNYSGSKLVRVPMRYMVV